MANPIRLKAKKDVKDAVDRAVAKKALESSLEGKKFSEMSTKDKDDLLKMVALKLRLIAE